MVFSWPWTCFWITLQSPFSAFEQVKWTKSGLRERWFYGCKKKNSRVRNFTLKENTSRLKTRKRQCLLHKFVRWSQPFLFAVCLFVFPASKQSLVFLVLYKSCNVKFSLSNTPVLEWKFYYLCNFPSAYLELWHTWKTRSFHVDSPPHIDKLQFHSGTSHS